MKRVLVSFATADYAPYQAINRITGLRAGFDECRSFGPADIDAGFAARHAAILAAPRGAGYWLWKPYVVTRVLYDLGPGDFLCYADAAMHFIAPVAPLFSTMDEQALDLLVLGEGFSEARYTKRDAFVLTGSDATGFVDTPQRFASCFVLRNTPWSKRFVERYLELCTDPRILTDAPNTCGLPNYPCFEAHRHDQSVFSLLTKQADIPVAPVRWIAEGTAGGLREARSEQIIDHTRAHRTPAEIAASLLARGLLEVSDLPALTARFPGQPTPSA